ncbi:MAG: hypothetical protein PHI63_04460, partial [Patescibacteria group bacterium]|nr:hypothetical protein [Patescibacteria group bacterium]
FFIVLSAATAFLFLPRLPVQTLPRSPIIEDLRATYAQYSRYLDTQWDGSGWNYAVPSPPYREISRNSHDNLRLQMTLATFYRFRTDAAATAMVQSALRNALIELPAKQSNAVKVNGVQTSTRSFHDMIGLYLALRVLDQHPGILPAEEKRRTLENIKTILPWALQANDTENRAMLGAAYAAAILNHPLLIFTPEEQKKYTNLIRQKVATGLQSVDDQYLYHEGTPPQFSLHYHLVSADMLWYVGHALNEPRYLDIATQMIQNVHIRYPKGRLQVAATERPNNAGLQLVLLRAVGEKILGSNDWEQYWQQEKVDRGFVDPQYPDRLVWLDANDATANDDYSFSNMAELFWETLNP